MLTGFNVSSLACEYEYYKPKGGGTLWNLILKVFYSGMKYDYTKG